MPAIREQTVRDERLTEVTCAHVQMNRQDSWGHFSGKNNNFAFHSNDAQQIETTWDCSLGAGCQSLPHVKEFKYLRVLFMSEGKMSDRPVGVASAVLWLLYQTVMVKRKLSLRVYWSVYVPVLTCGHEIWIMCRKDCDHPHGQQKRSGTAHS